MRAKKILFITDIHQNISNLKKVKFEGYDIVLCGGDFIDPVFPDLKKVKNIIDILPDNTITVPGNCDTGLAVLDLINSKLNNIHKKNIKVDGFDLCGVGFSRGLVEDFNVYRKYFLEDEERISDFYQKSNLKFILKSCGINYSGNKVKLIELEDAIEQNRDFINKFTFFREDEVKLFFDNIEKLDNGIIITHSPPYQLLDKINYLPNIGSKSIREAIDRLKPRLVLCGHFHELYGEIKHNGSIVFNPGALKDGYYGVIEIDDENVITHRVKI